MSYKILYLCVFSTNLIEAKREGGNIYGNFCKANAL
nr:hypothetical protein JOCKYQNQ_JOCKYQNQ_CDS_0029 [Autographiviridae sp.]